MDILLYFRSSSHAPSLGRTDDRQRGLMEMLACTGLEPIQTLLLYTAVSQNPGGCLLSLFFFFSFLTDAVFFYILL